MERYLPSLSTLVTLDDLPDSLGFIKDAGTSVLSNTYYDNFRMNSSRDGDKKDIRLTLLLDRQIGFELPGTNLLLLLNPNDALTGQPRNNRLDLRINWQLGILRYTNSFTPTQFSFSAEAFADLITNTIQIDDTSFLKAIALQLGRSEKGNIPFKEITIEKYIAIFNDYYALTGTPAELKAINIQSFDDFGVELAKAAITIADVIADFGIESDFPGGNDTIKDILERIDPEKEETQLSVKDLIASFNEHFQLSGTSLEIPYVANPETTMDEIMLALVNAGIFLDRVLLDFVVTPNADFAEAEEALASFLADATGTSQPQSFLELFKPQLDVEASLDEVILAIEFPREYLVPLDTNNEPFEDPAIRSRLEFSVGSMGFSSEGGFVFDSEKSLSFSKSQIGNTGLTLAFTEMKLDLSSTSNIAEAIADNRPADFMGVFVSEGVIGFPAFWNQDEDPTSKRAQIKAENVLIGTGGISGLLSLAKEAGQEGPLFKLGEPGNNEHFALTLDRFELQLKQNTIISSKIEGTLIVPGFRDGDTGNAATLDVTASFDNHGNFLLSADATSNPLKFSIPDALDIAIHSLSIGREDKRWYLDVSGTIQITATVPGEEIIDFIKQPIEVKRLRIWQDGKIEFAGGGITLPTNLHMSIGPVSLAVSHISFGSHGGIFNGTNRQYYCLGFNGELNTGSAGVSVRGDGVEFHFTADIHKFHCYLRIVGIGVDISIPGNATAEEADIIIKGYLSLRAGPDINGVESSQPPEYYGSVTLDIRSLSIAAKASMKLSPKIPSFIVDIELDIPTPIPLGSTGLGIYGFRGLLGSHYIPSKTYIGMKEEDSWYEFLKKKVPKSKKDGIVIEKFDPQKEGVSLGAGASIATMGDNGWAFSSKVFVLLSLPGLLLVEGKANILHERLGVDNEEDPPFYGFLLIDKESIQAALGINYLVPDNGSHRGDILDMKGDLQAGFFFNDSSAWYINLGKDQPEEKRIQARMLRIFDAYAFMMINHTGVRAGGGAKLSIQKNLGPVRFGFVAFIDARGSISFKPVQIGGAVLMAGNVSISVGRFGYAAQAAVGVSAEAPSPFVLAGYMEFKLRLAWFLKIRIRVELVWAFNTEFRPVEIPLLEGNTGKTPFKAISMLSQEAFMVNTIEPPEGKTFLQWNPDPTNDSRWNDFRIPMDSFFDIEFSRPVKPFTTRYGGGLNPLPSFRENVAPVRARYPQLSHDLLVENISLYIWNRSSKRWETYDVWEALKVSFEKSGLTPSNISAFPYGHWQYNNQPGKYTSLRILSQSPFSVTNSIIPEKSGLLSHHILCPAVPAVRTCQTWIGTDPLTIYPAEQPVRDRGIILFLRGEDGVVDSIPNVFLVNQSLKINVGHASELFFPEPIVSVELLLTSLRPVRISYYEKIFIEPKTISGIINFSYRLIETKEYSTIELQNPIVFESSEIAFDKIGIQSPSCNADISSGISIPDYIHLLTQPGSAMLKHPNPTEAEKKTLEKWLAFLSSPFSTRALEDRRCFIFLHKVCWLTRAQAAHNIIVEENNQETIDADLNALAMAINETLPPLWRPNSYFAIEVTTNDSLPGQGIDFRNSSTAVFRTAGSLGFFHQEHTQYKQLLSEGKEDQYKLANLKHYIDYGRSFPNADGKLLNAKPLYYKKPELGLFFTIPYVYEFFTTWGEYRGNDPEEYKLLSLIKDPLDKQNGNIIAPQQLGWIIHKGKDSIETGTPDITIISNILHQGNTPCRENIALLRPPTLSAILERQDDIAPQKLYTAVFNAVHGKNAGEKQSTVHSYPFETSRYGDFTEHVNSYISRQRSGDQETIIKAIYTINIEVAAPESVTMLVEKMQALLQDKLPAADPLFNSHASVLDRIVSGVLGLKQLEALTNTEFAIIRFTITGQQKSRIIGVLARSPEPFNDPKLPASELQRTLRVSEPANPSELFRYVFGNDSASVFISNDNMDLPERTINLLFRHILFNGKVYQVGQSVNVPLTLEQQKVIP
ncbi:hypothetical protein [Ferruginibacter sp. SUN106]|uniref:hypothetical protein n=1 Tax=Ferruginibacter sp. SUN106 TaxID=2978348 RepID=UPI003D36192C